MPGGDGEAVADFATQAVLRLMLIMSPKVRRRWCWMGGDNSGLMSLWPSGRGDVAFDLAPQSSVGEFWLRVWETVYRRPFAPFVDATGTTLWR